MSQRTASNNRIVLGIFVALFISFAIGCTSVSKECDVYRFTNEEKEQLLSGDIILRRGSGIVSDMIVGAFKEARPVSHCGIICREGDSLFVIHSISSQLSEQDGMQTCSVDDFTSIAIRGSVVVTRFRSDDDENYRIVEFAKRYLQKELKFDYKFDTKDSSRIFCSELIRDAVRAVYGVDLFKDSNKSSSGFESFYNPDYFDLIVDHRHLMSK